MGIEGLLRSLKQTVKVRHLREYKGLTLAVDTYCWLHRIIKGSCINEIAQGRLSDRFIKECLNRIECLQLFGITVIMVFDGGLLPIKQAEQSIRHQRRQECYRKADELMSKGQLELAKKKIAEAFDVTPELAAGVIRALKEKGVQFLVAPYEADAQLAYLSISQKADVIVTEDSDLLAFGAKRILYKLDFGTLAGEQISLEDLESNKDPDLASFTTNMFLSACILSGCDYLGQVKGVGLKSAFQLMKRHRTSGKVINHLRFKTKNVPTHYQRDFIRSFLTFRFQTVYCPKLMKCVAVGCEDPIKYITELSKRACLMEVNWEDELIEQDMLEYAVSLAAEEWDFVGKRHDSQLARRIAEGGIHPTTLLPYKASSDTSSQSDGRDPAKTKLKDTNPSQLQDRNRVLTRYNQCRKECKLQRIYLEQEQDYLDAKLLQAKPTKPKRMLLLTDTVSAVKRKELVGELFSLERTYPPHFNQQQTATDEVP